MEYRNPALLRVLLYSTDEHQQLALSEFLGQDYALLMANSRKEATSLFAHHKTNISGFITDLKTLKKQGLDLLTKAKQQYPGLPAIITKHVGSLPLSENVLNRRVIQYLREPFEYPYLQTLLAPPVPGVSEIQTLELIDLVQLYCLSEATVALTVMHGSNADEEHGHLYFEQGTLTHAVHGTRQGETAFYELMRQGRGRFFARYEITAKVKDITVPWEHLYLEYLHILTEKPNILNNAGSSSDSTHSGPMEDKQHDSEHIMATQAIQSQRTILIIDDDKNIRNLLRKSFEKSGFVVLSAENGRVGLEQAVASLPDVILSDVMMPEMTGYELCRKVKAHPKTRDIPIILLTARGDTDSTLEGFQAGADEYIAKPFEIQEVLARVQRVCRWVNKKQDSDTRLSGNLNKTPMFELLRFCEEHRISGTIQLTRSDDAGATLAGVIHLQLGEITSIELGDHTDMTEALDELLEWTDGTFVVKQEELQLPGEEAEERAEHESAPGEPEEETTQQEPEPQQSPTAAAVPEELKAPLHRILEELNADSEELEYALITDDSGHVISAVTNADSSKSLEELGLSLANLLQFSGKIDRSLHIGPLQEIVVLSELGIVLVSPVEHLGVLGVATDKENQGMMRWNCKEAIDKITDMLSNMEGVT